MSYYSVRLVDGTLKFLPAWMTDPVVLLNGKFLRLVAEVSMKEVALFSVSGLPASPVTTVTGLNW